MSLRKAQDQWFAHMASSGYSDRTLQSYRMTLSLLWKRVDRENIESMDEDQWRTVTDTMQKHYAPESFRHFMSTWRTLFRYALEMGHIEKDLTGYLPKIKKVRPLPKAVMSVAQVKRLIMTPDIDTSPGFRDRTILLTFYTAALRRRELVTLDIDDFDEGREVVLVKRKGGDDQSVPVGALGAEYLRIYIQDVRPRFSPKENTLFLNQNGSRISWASIYPAMMRHYKIAGLGAFNLHSLRHAAATHMVASGADLRAVQAFLGHRSMESTAVYTRVDGTTIRNMVDKLSLIESANAVSVS